MAEARVVFQNANLIDGGDGPPLSNASVAIEGKRIVHAGAGPAPVRAGDRVIDLAGKTLMPGLVQGHFHSGFGPSPTLGAAPILGLEAAPAYMGMIAARNARIALHVRRHRRDRLEQRRQPRRVSARGDDPGARRGAAHRRRAVTSSCRRATWPTAPTARGSWASSTPGSRAGSTAPSNSARPRARRSGAAAT